MGDSGLAVGTLIPVPSETHVDLDHLIDVLKNGAVAVHDGHTDPDDDWASQAVILGKHKDKQCICYMPLPPMPPAWGHIILKICDELAAECAAILTPAISLDLSPGTSSEAFEELLLKIADRGIANMPGAVEALCIAAFDRNTTRHLSARIYRSATKPPALGEFQEDDDEETLADDALLPVRQWFGEHA